MDYLSLGDVIFSFVLVLLYIIILYLIIKQSFRVITFGDTLVYIKEKNVRGKQYYFLMFINVVLSILYLMTIFREIQLDKDLALLYDYYDMLKLQLILKWSLSFMPVLILILLSLYYVPKDRISERGIVSDKFAFRWEEIKKVEIDNNTVKIHYDYKFIFFDFSFIYTINESTDEVIETINNHTNKQ
ncbi:hypothetical protein Amet_0880 [Alkaliphilus metalliredigens QYMF]|uniref:Uncharacterized protein n=1 Tax=Alkaliphilus metalliredigens (strain QYMF) TaxID=293826 RepID=A6TLN4_ALKMQ|nr:hypothetical protein [Alkaliphilus metalliredigens]ABR47102.1 hypothetical protein Amet_0880 [Alkaliphilus metalliredigens QYMF]